MKWKLIEELPEGEGTYIICLTGEDGRMNVYPSNGYMDDNGKWFDGTTWGGPVENGFWKVSHWMPLPEAPNHASDCALHNMPAMPNGPCDCGVL